MWDGYAALDGIEFINVARTEAYAEGQGWFRPVYRNEHLADLLDQGPYTTPALDGAPWYDPDSPESEDFYGLYPLEVTGLDDSSRTSQVIESTREGGVPGRLRHATRTVVVNAVLLAASEKGVEYGAKWLRRALLGDLCANPSLDTGIGTNLNLLATPPEDGDTYEDLSRWLRKFTVNSGPVVTGKRNIETCGGVVWMVTFTGVAGSPYVFGETRPILNGYLTPATVTRNEAKNPGAEVDLTSIVAAGSAAGNFTRDTSLFRTGMASAKRALTASGTNGIRYDLATPVSTEDEIVRWGVWVRPSVTTNFHATWSGITTSTSASISATVGSAVSCPAGTWTLVTGEATVAADQTLQRAGVITSGSEASGFSVNTDDVIIVIGIALPDFFSGDTTDTPEYDYGWESTANNSASLRTGTPAPWAADVVEGTVDLVPTEWAEVACGADTWEPLYDPLCPPLVAPPAPPSLPLGCLVIPETWDRYTAILPAGNVPLWEEVAPVVGLATAEEQRNIRVRIYADPGEDLDLDASPCAFAIDMVVSYLPAGATMTIDMGTEEVWVETVTGQRRRADALVVTTDSRPVEWVTLSCGWQHVVTIDTEVGVDPPVVDFALTPRAR